MNNANNTIRDCITRIVESSKPMKFADVGVFQGYVYGYNKDYPDSVDVVSMDNSIVIKGVSLSALYGNGKGVIMKPTLKSEITVLVVGGVDGYAIALTHLDSHSTIARIQSYIGVTGVKEALGDEDYDELDDNGKKSGTTYTETSATTSVESNKKSSKITVEFNSIINQVLDSASVTISDKVVEQKAGNNTITLTDQQMQVIASKILLGANATENAVLGLKLQTALNAFIDQVAAITTVTSLGTMPIMNIAQVQAIKSQVAQILSNTNFIE